MSVGVNRQIVQHSATQALANVGHKAHLETKSTKKISKLIGMGSSSKTRWDLAMNFGFLVVYWWSTLLLEPLNAAIFIAIVYVYSIPEILYKWNDLLTNND